MSVGKIPKFLECKQSNDSLLYGVGFPRDLLSQFIPDLL